jgi:hypothetical protein
MKDGFLAWLVGENGRAALAGAAGGLVRWLALKSSPIDGLISMVVGLICAIYLGPLALPLLEYGGLGKVVVEEVNRASFAGFIIGMGGIGVAAFIIDMLARVRDFRKKEAGNGGG